MKTKILTLFMLVVLIAGCSDGNDSSTTNKAPFIGGTSSIDISFEEGAPPAEVYGGKQYPFDIIINLKNSGEYDVNKEDLAVKIKGIEPGLFGITHFEKNAENDLFATKKDSEGNKIEGSQSIVQFTNLNYQDDLDATIQNLPIKADVCYKYGTKARSNICIKEDVLDQKESDICTINEDKKVQNSAGPIQITETKEAAQGTNKVAFMFKVKHVGMGEVYAKDSSCSGERIDDNKVWVDVDTGLEGVTCSGFSSGSGTTGVVNLGSTGERTIRCTLDVSTITTDFEKSISFEIVYDYLKTVSTGITIKPNVE